MTSCLCRFWVYLLCVVYCLVYPTLWICIERYGMFTTLKSKTVWFAIMYVIVLNILVVRLVGRYIVSAVTYPFSNIFASTYLKRNLNAKFGNEFCKRIDHMSNIIGIFTTINDNMNPENLPANSSSH